MKQRFKCLEIPLRTDLHNTLPIIIACACLHNYAIRVGDTNNTTDTSENDVFLPVPRQDDVADIQVDANISNTPTGEAVRRRLIENHF